MQTHHCIRIVGASVTVFGQHDDCNKPFFQFFKIKTLEGLNAEETRQLLLGLGSERQTRNMQELLNERPGKIEALRRLTAGVPRTMILLFEIFLDERGSALDALEALLDRVTPLYKHHLDDLPAQQQAIVNAIALGWDAMSAKEIAAKTHLPSKQVSAQLGQLEKNRLIRRIPTSTKNHLYQLEERFFNIWCLMRLGRRNDKQRAVWLVKFLENWCDKQELAERAERHLDALRTGQLAPRHALLWSQALAQSLSDFELQRRVLDTTRELFPQVAENLPDPDSELFAKGGEAFARGDFKNALKLVLPLVEKGYPGAMNGAALIYIRQGKPEQAEQCYLNAIEKKSADAMLGLANLYREQGAYSGPS